MISHEIDSSFGSSFILRVFFFITLVLYLLDFISAVCDFVRFYLIVILKQNVNFSFNIYSSLLYQWKRWKN